MSETLTPPLTPASAPEERPLEPTTPIRPSEAIRLGCLTTAPWIGAPFGPDGQTCAIGAALVGWFGDAAEAREYGYTEFERRSGDAYLGCPACRVHGVQAISETVFHLNDGHKWSRERIADWLAGQRL